MEKWSRGFTSIFLITCRLESDKEMFRNTRSGEVELLRSGLVELFRSGVVEY